MKKYIGLTALLCVLTLATQAYAVTTWSSSNCEDKGGTTVTVGTQTFCKSGAKMNWWSAYAWCEGMGGKMPTIWELCPNMPSLTNQAACGSTYSGGAWSTTPSDNNGHIWVASSNIGSGGWKPATDTFAYCLPNGSN